MVRMIFVEGRPCFCRNISIYKTGGSIGKQNSEKLKSYNLFETKPVLIPRSVNQKSRALTIIVHDVSNLFVRLNYFYEQNPIFCPGSLWTYTITK